MDARLRKLQNAAAIGGEDEAKAYFEAWNRAGRPHCALALSIFLEGIFVRPLEYYENSPEWEDWRGNGKKTRQRKARQEKREDKKAEQERRATRVRWKGTKATLTYGQWIHRYCVFCAYTNIGEALKPTQIIYQGKWCGALCRDCCNLSRKKRADRIKEGRYRVWRMPRIS